MAEVHQPPCFVFPPAMGTPAHSSMDYSASSARTITSAPLAVTIKRAHKRGYRSPGRAPIAAPDSLLDVANDSDSLEQFVSPMSTSPETTAAASRGVERASRGENHSSATSYATPLTTGDGDENANNRANVNPAFSPAGRLTANDNRQKRIQDTAANHISHFHDAHPFS